LKLHVDGFHVDAESLYGKPSFTISIMSCDSKVSDWLFKMFEDETKLDFEVIHGRDRFMCKNCLIYRIRPIVDSVYMKVEATLMTTIPVVRSQDERVKVMLT